MSKLELFFAGFMQMWGEFTGSIPPINWHAFGYIVGAVSIFLSLLGGFILLVCGPGFVIELLKKKPTYKGGEIIGK